MSLSARQIACLEKALIEALTTAPGITINPDSLQPLCDCFKQALEDVLVDVKLDAASIADIQAAFQAALDAVVVDVKLDPASIAEIQAAFQAALDAVVVDVKLDPASIADIQAAVTAALEAAVIDVRLPPQPVLGEPVCMKVDGVATSVQPFSTYDGTSLTLVGYIDPATMAMISGAVTAAQPCDCVCECPTADLELTKRVISAEGSSVGDKITYRFTVCNRGELDITNVTLTEQLIGAVVTGGPIAMLAVGECDTNTFSATYALTQADLDRGYVDNYAKASGTDSNGNLVTDTNNDPARYTLPTVPPTVPRMSLVKTITSYSGTASSAKAGDIITYSLVVSNTGNVDLTNVVVSDSNATVTGSPISSLPVGQSVTLTATHTVTATEISAGKVDNQAMATGTAPDGTSTTALSQSSATSAPGPTTQPLGPATAGLSVSKSFSPSPMSIGTASTFTISVTNTGTAAASNVAVTDVLPSPLTYVAASIAGGTSRVDTSPSGTGLQWTISSLAAGASVDLTFRATASTLTSFTNVATASATGVPSASGSTTGQVCSTSLATGMSGGTFGTQTGNFAPLPVANRGSYVFAMGGGSEGTYSIVNSAGAAAWGAWGPAQGHTSGGTDPNDAFLFMNGATSQVPFYRDTFTMNAAGAVDFGLWAANAMRYPGWPVDVAVRIRDASGAVVATCSTGTIPSPGSNTTVWYPAKCTTTLAAGSYTLEAFSLVTTANGNDFMVDDIFVRPAGATSVCS